MENICKKIIIILISIILASSGCIKEQKEDSMTIQKNDTINNESEQINRLMNKLVPNKTSIYEDEKFIKIVEEANNIIDNSSEQITSAAKKGDFDDIEKYGKNLESNTTKYLSILKSLTVSPKFKKMYYQYYNYLEDMNKAGQHILETAKEHKLMGNISCNNPYMYDEKM